MDKILTQWRRYLLNEDASAAGEVDPAGGGDSVFEYHLVPVAAIQRDAAAAAAAVAAGSSTPAARHSLPEPRVLLQH